MESIFVGNVYAAKGIGELIQSINSIDNNIEVILCGNANIKYIENFFN
ncbi:MAG: hypothetical protein ACQERD_10670 [Campylobacterota bacterium]